MKQNKWNRSRWFTWDRSLVYLLRWIYGSSHISYGSEQWMRLTRLNPSPTSRGTCVRHSLFPSVRRLEPVIADQTTIRSRIALLEHNRLWNYICSINNTYLWEGGGIKRHITAKRLLEFVFSRFDSALLVTIGNITNIFTAPNCSKRTAERDDCTFVYTLIGLRDFFQSKQDYFSRILRLSPTNAVGFCADATICVGHCFTILMLAERRWLQCRHR